MNAYVLHNTGDIRFEDIDIPKPSSGQVIVEVKASGICGSDIPRIYKTGAHRHPLIPGHEFSGKVVYANEDCNIKAGERVGVYPLIPCGSCNSCQKQLFELCNNYNYIGSRCNGGFAEYAVVPEKNLLVLPDNVSYVQAAMLEPMAVAVHAIRKSHPEKNDITAVCGLGTIGLLIVEFLLDLDIKNIIVIGNKDLQLQKAKELGIPEKNCIDSRKNMVLDTLKEICGDNGGADVFFECVGKNETILQTVKGTAAGGRAVIVGNPNSDIVLEKDAYWRILRRELTVMGIWNSSFKSGPDDDWNYALTRLSERKVIPEALITHTLTLAELRKGFEIMRNKSEDYIKIIYSANRV